MKGNDLKKFWITIIISFLIGLFIFKEDFNSYSDIITFLSIMISFKICSLAILFSSPLLKTLRANEKVKPYQTELHKIKDYYKHSIMFEMISIILVFVIPDVNIDLLNDIIHVGKQSIAFPILIGSAYCLCRVCDYLFTIFTHPTNK